MSRMCPYCKHEINDNAKFCPFCAAFTGEKEKEKKKSRAGLIIGGVSGAVVLGGAALAVLVFDVFGIFKNEPEHLTGTGDKLFIQSITPVCIDGKWGYADKDGNTEVKPQYTAAYAFNEDINDVAPAAVDGKFGYIRKDGEFATEPQYSFAGSFSAKGLARVTDENGRSGFVDSIGRKAFDGQMFDYASDMNDSGYAFAYTLMMPEIAGGTESGNYYEIIYKLLSSDGKITELANGTGISAVYDDRYIGFRQAESNDETTLDFTREYAVFSADGTALTDYYDRIVKSGKLLIVCDGTDDDSGLYKVKLLKADTLGQIGGEYLCGADVKQYDSGAVLLKKDSNGFIRDVLIDDDGNEIFMSYDGSHIVSGFDMSGYACVYEKGKYCGYTASGKQFENDFQFGSFNCGLAPFYDNAKIGYINTAGEKVLDAQFDGASEYYADGYAYIKSGTEYSVIDMSGNTVIERLSYASDKLMFADTAQGWYDPSDFEGFDGENMFLGNFCFVELADDVMNGRTEDYIYSNMIPAIKDGKLCNETYRKYNSDYYNYYIDDGRFIVYNRQTLDGRIVNPDDGLTETDVENELVNASVIDTDSARLVRYSEENRTVAKDLFENKVILQGSSQKFIMGEYTACDIINGDKPSQVMIYDNRLCPVLTVSSPNSFNLYEYGDMVYITSFMSERERAGSDKNAKVKKKYALIDKNNGHVYTAYEKNFTVLGKDFYKITEKNSLSEYFTAYGKSIGKFVYAKEYGDRLMCFDYDKYYIYDKYGQLLAQYESKPRISKNSGSVVIRNDDGSFTCFDRDFNVILETRYDIQPLENGYMAYATAENGRLGFLDKNGDVAVEAKYEFVSAMSPDGYFVSKEHREYEDGSVANGYEPGLIDAVVNNRNGEATEKISGVCNAGNSAANGYSPLDFYAGAEYYENTPEITENIEYCIFVTDDGERLYYIDVYGNYQYEEYYVNNSVDSYYMSPGIIDGTTVTLSVLMYDETGKNSATVNYYLNLDGTPFVKGDRTLIRLSEPGYIIGENGNGRYNIYGTHGKALLSDIEIAKKAEKNLEYSASVFRNGNKLSINDANGTRIFDLETKKLLFEKEDDRVYFTAENLISYDDGDEMIVYRNLDNGKEYFCDGSMSFLNLNRSYTDEKVQFPLWFVKQGNNNVTGTQHYAGYDSVDVYQLDENMEESFVRSYTAGEGESLFEFSYGNKLLVYGLTETDYGSHASTWTFINVMLDKRVTVDNVSEVNQGKNKDRDCLDITVQNDDETVTRYEFYTDTMELEETESER